MIEFTKFWKLPQNTQMRFLGVYRMYALKDMNCKNDWRFVKGECLKRKRLKTTVS